MHGYKAKRYRHVNQKIPHQSRRVFSAVLALAMVFTLLTVPPLFGITAEPPSQAQVDRPASDPWEQQTVPQSREKLVTVTNSDFSIYKDTTLGSTGQYANSDYFDPERIPNALGISTFGWKTRPTDHTAPVNNRNYQIELQRANTMNGFALTDYKGQTGANAVYAELNASIQGTLYQEIPTNPGESLYYSFFHSVRRDSQQIPYSHDSNNDQIYSENGTAGTGTVPINKLNFYLSGKPEFDKFGANGEPDKEFNNVNFDKNGRIVVRPCWTIINSTKGTTADDASWVKHGINYGWQGFLFYNESTKKNEIRYGYLYDVWDTAKKIGVTYYKTPAKNSAGAPWSPTTKEEPVSGTNTTDTQAQLDAIKLASYTNGDGFGEGNYAATIIGYWDVGKGADGAENGWKRYIGKYVVPTGYDIRGGNEKIQPQTLTEYAYESTITVGNASYGNYLDGVTFRSGADLGIDTNVNDKSQASLPGSTMRAQINVTNYGAMNAGNVLVENKLSPFDAYMDYVGNCKVINKTTGADITNQVTLNFDAINKKITFDMGNGVIRGFQDRIENGETNADGTTASVGDTITIYFDVKVRTLIDQTNHSTAGKYIKDQATVTYKDKDTSENNPLYEKVKRSVSAVEQVFIIDVFLEKTATEITDTAPPYTESDGNGNPLQFFMIHLKVQGDVGLYTNNISLDKPAVWGEWDTTKQPAPSAGDAVPYVIAEQSITDLSGNPIAPSKITGGDSYRMNIKVTNTGKSAANNVTLFEVLAPYYEYMEIVNGSIKIDSQSANHTLDTTVGKETITVPIGTIHPGETKAVTGTFTIRNTGRTTSTSANGVNIDHKVKLTYENGAANYMNCSEVATIVVASVKLTVHGEIVDTLPADYELTAESIADIANSGGKLSYAVDAAGITTIKKNNILIELAHKTAELSFSVKHIAGSYGALFSNKSAAFTYYIDDHPDGKSTAFFPMPSVNLKPKTTNDSFDAILLNTATTKPILANDAFYPAENKRTEDGWTVSDKTITITDSSGAAKTYSDAIDGFTATYANDQLTFKTPKDGNYFLYYTVSVTASKGAVTKALTSRPTLVSFKTTNASTLPSLIVTKQVTENGGAVNSGDVFVFKLANANGSLKSDIILTSAQGKNSQALFLPAGTYSITEVPSMNYSLFDMTGASLHGTNGGSYDKTTKTYTVTLVNGDITSVTVTNAKSGAGGIAGAIDNNLQTSN